MKEQLEIMYTMDVLEFAIGVNLMGKKWVTAPDSVRESASTAEILKTLQLMVNKKMIEQSGTAFKLCEPYRELFSGIINAGGIVEITVRKRREIPLFCYMGESVWCVTPDIMNHGRIKCRKIDDLNQYLEENEYLPVSLDHSRITEWEELQAEEGTAEGENCFQMVYRSVKTGREEWKIGINEGPCDTVLWVSEAGCSHVMNYNLGKIDFLVKKFLKEEAYGIS